MRNVPVWIDDTPIRKFPKLQRTISVDVLVVGAGVTGITTAYLLKKAGSTVALIDRERVASIDTGHTTAHLTCVTDVQLQELARNFGDDHAQAAWDAGAAAIDEIERIVEEEGSDCEFTRVPAYLHVPVDGSSKKEASSLKKEADLAAKLGFDAVYLNSAPYFNLPAARFANQAKFHPRKYLRSLVEKISGSGSHVFEKSAAKANIDRRWSGQVICTPDGLPYIGENAEHQFVATGYCGNGITFGTVAAIMARDWTTGRKNPWTDLFAVARKKIKGAMWNYLRENKDYPYYMIKDRLARAEADSVRELKPGEGMITGRRGKKVAAFRDPGGNIHRLSPVCTHLGCLVRWNPAESTWDCPCHGSRFKPTGEVIAGPAEEPLPSI